MKRRATIQVVVAIVAVALANTSRAQGASQQPQGRSGATYYRNASGSSAGTATRAGSTTYYRNANGSSAGRRSAKRRNRTLCE